MNKFFDILTKIEKGVAGSGIILLTIFIIVDVLSRELFRIGFPWAQKSSVYLMIWAGFLGAALTSEKAAHLRPEIADKLWSKKIHLFVRIQNFLIMCFSFMMAFYAVTYVKETHEFGDMNVIINIKMWVLQLILPYTFLSMGLRHLRFIIDPALALKRKEEEQLA